MGKDELYYYSNKEINNSFDIVDLKINIIPKCINKNDYKFSELLNIKKITFTIFNNYIKRIYVHGIHPNCNIENNLFKTDYFKNKKVYDDSIIFNFKESIVNHYNECFNLYFSNKFNLIKRFVIDNTHFYFFSKKIFNLNYDMYEIRKRIVPHIVVDENNNLFRIKKISNNFIIERIKIFTYNDKIQSIYIDSPHPNSRITDRNYCIPPFLKQQNIFNVKISLIEDLLKMYFLRNPYFYPWRFIECQTY